MGEHLSDSAANFYFREMLLGGRAYQVNAEQQAVQFAAFEAQHRQNAAEAGRRLEAQSLRMPTLADIRTPYAERTFEGRPLVSYDDDFLRSLGIRP